ncbi:MAG: GDSL-type esterase/lipase family protein [Thermoanaerobaculia bacterium]
MRRLFLWYLPAGLAFIAALVFAYGLVAFLRGDTGTPVEIPSARIAPQPVRSGVMPIVLGDSLARGAGDERGLGISGRLDEELGSRRIPAQRTVNLGVSGARTADLLRRLEAPNVRQLIAEANVVIVSIGGNDLWGGAGFRDGAPPNPEEVMGGVLEQVGEVVKRVREANPGARIFFVGLYNPFAANPAGTQLTPLVNRWNADLLARFGSDPNFVLVQTADLFTHRDRLSVDRFHPGGEAYGLIARRIADAL